MSALRSYSLLVRWQALRMKGFLPLAIVVQALFALGIVLGYPLLFPSLDSGTILYLATGAPAITLITMGLVAVPQVVAQARTEGTLDYMRGTAAASLDLSRRRHVDLAGHRPAGRRRWRSPSPSSASISTWS